MFFFKKSLYRKLFSKFLLVYFFQALGLPVLIFDIELQWLRIINSKKVSILIFLIFMILNFLWNLNGVIYTLYDQVLEKFSKFSKIIEIGIRIWTFTSVLIILIIFKMKNEKCAKLNIRIAQVKSNSLLLSTTTERFVEKFTIKSLLLFTIFSILWWTTIITPAFTQSVGYFFYRLSYQINSLILHAVVLQFTFLIMFMIQELKIINEALLNIKHECLHGSTIVKSIVLNDPVFKLKNLQDINNLYLHTYKLSKAVSDCYSLPIFLSIFKIFISLVEYSYYILESVMVRRVDLPTDRYMYFYLNEATLVLCLLYLCSSANLLIVEVSKHFIFD